MESQFSPSGVILSGLHLSPPHPSTLFHNVLNLSKASLAPLCSHRLVAPPNAFKDVGHVCFYLLSVLDLWLLEKGEWNDSRLGLSSKLLVLDQGMIHSSNSINLLSLIHSVSLVGAHTHSFNIHWMRKDLLPSGSSSSFDLSSFYFETSTSPRSQSVNR